MLRTRKDRRAPADYTAVAIADAVDGYCRCQRGRDAPPSGGWGPAHASRGVAACAEHDGLDLNLAATTAVAPRSLTSTALEEMQTGC